MWGQKLQIWNTFKLWKRSEPLFHLRFHHFMFQNAYHNIELKLPILLCGYQFPSALVYRSLFCITLTLYSLMMLQRFLILVTSTFGLTLCCNNCVLKNGLLNLNHGKLTSRDDFLSLYLFSSLLSHSSWLVWKYCRTPTQNSCKTGSSASSSAFEHLIRPDDCGEGDQWVELVSGSTAHLRREEEADIEILLLKNSQVLQDSRFVVEESSSSQCKAKGQEAVSIHCICWPVACKSGL